MASMVRSVGRHLGSRHGRQKTAPSADSPTDATTTRDERAAAAGTSPSSSPFAKRRHASTSQATSPLQSPLAHQHPSPQSPTSPSNTAAVAITAGIIGAQSNSSLSESCGQLSSAPVTRSNSSSADCLQLGGQRPLSDSTLSLDPTGSATELNAASMDLHKLLSGVERFQTAIGKLREQFVRKMPPCPEPQFPAGIVASLTFMDKSGAVSSPTTESDSSQFGKCHL